MPASTAALISADGGHPLPLTGERTVPGVVHERYWFARHLAAYEWARPLARGARVVDAGCGEGYGAALLARTATSATGVDLDAAAVAHARRAYPQATFQQAELGAVDLPDHGVDLVVSFQVVEHLWDVGAYLAEVARLLRPGGRFACATPNRLTFTPGSDVPVNPFHTREFTAAELVDVLAPRFRVEAVLGVHHGPRLRAVEALARRSLPDLVLARPPAAWPAWLHRVVAAVRPGDFPLCPDALDDSLDLVVLATPRATPAGLG